MSWPLISEAASDRFAEERAAFRGRHRPRCRALRRFAPGRAESRRFNGLAALGAAVPLESRFAPCAAIKIQPLNSNSRASYQSHLSRSASHSALRSTRAANGCQAACPGSLASEAHLLHRSADEDDQSREGRRRTQSPPARSLYEYTRETRLRSEEVIFSQQFRCANMSHARQARRLRTHHCNQAGAQA